MGYDMRARVTHPEYEAARLVREQQGIALEARGKELRPEAGSWTTPEEEATLSPEEVRDLGLHRRADWLKTERARRVGDPWDTMVHDALLAQTVPASEEYVAHRKAQDDFWNSAIPHDPYFRLNVGGMSVYRETMVSLGMGHWEFDPGEWPDAPDLEGDDTLDALQEARYEVDLTPRDAGYREAVVSEAEKGLGREIPSKDVDRWLKYREALERHVEVRDTTRKGISLHKFCSNDGWFVTPEECAEAVIEYRKKRDRRWRSATPIGNRRLLYPGRNGHTYSGVAKRQHVKKWLAANMGATLIQESQ